MSTRAATLIEQLRHRLRTAPLLRSTFVKLWSFEVIDLLATCDLDAVTIDLEHSQLDEVQARLLIGHAVARGVPPIVRVPSVDRGLLNRVIEAGAAGIQLSTLTRIAEVEELRSSTRYAPHGTRSVSLSHPAAGYGADPLHVYLERSAAGPVLIGQIETAHTADPLDELVGRLDVAFIGTTDLTVDLGRPGELDAPEVQARIGEIADAVAATATTVLGGWVPTFAAAAPLIDRGARFITAGSDLAVLADALVRSFRPRHEQEEDPCPPLPSSSSSSQAATSSIPPAVTTASPTSSSRPAGSHPSATPSDRPAPLS